MNRFAGTIFLLLMLLLAPAWKLQAGSGPQFPDGWRAPVESDYSKGNRSFFTNGIPSQVIADFNGDGLGDQAWILINENAGKYGLFAFLGDKSGRYRVLILDKVKKESKYLNMGISMMPAGEYPTACGKGYGRCSEDQPKTVKFKYSGINYFVFESANSVFYWDDTTQKFREIWMSD